MKDQILARINDRTARIAVIGLGYVGLPLAVAFAERGYRVTGIDVDAGKVEMLNRGELYVQDVPAQRLAPLLLAAKPERTDAGSGAGGKPHSAPFRATTEYAALADCDAAIICVPTPLNKTRDPDVRFLIPAGECDRRAHPPRHADLPRIDHLPRHDRGAAAADAYERAGAAAAGDRALRAGQRLLPGLLARAHRPGTQGLRGREHAEGGRRRDRRLPRGGRCPLLRRRSRRWCRSRLRRPPRWSSCWRTPSARSTSPWSTRWRSCATSWGSTCGR